MNVGMNDTIQTNKNALAQCHMQCTVMTISPVYVST